jgi:predicted DNA-binding protein
MVDKKKPAQYALRLPLSLKNKLEQLADQDGISINQFIATAVAEKIAAMETASFFENRRETADFSAFERIMKREGGEPPQPGDEVINSMEQKND